jgi:hypothetical protein
MVFLWSTTAFARVMMREHHTQEAMVVDLVAGIALGAGHRIIAQPLGVAVAAVLAVLMSK